MTIQEQISEDLKTAMKTRDRELTSYLRVVIAEFSRIKTDDGSKEYSDEVIIKELRKLEENAKEMDNQFEVNALSKYLPKKLSRDEINIIVRNIVSANNITSMKEMGKFMGILKLYPEASLIDNTIATTIFKEAIS